MTSRCAGVRGNRLFCECVAVDAGGRVLGGDTTVQVVLSEEAVQARIGEPARLQQRTGSGDVLPDGR